MHQRWLLDHGRMPSLGQLELCTAATTVVRSPPTPSDRVLNSWSWYTGEHSPFLSMSPMQLWLSHVVRGTSSNTRLLQRVVRDCTRRKRAYRDLRRKREARLALQELEMTQRTVLLTAVWSEWIACLVRELFARRTSELQSFQRTERLANFHAAQRERLSADEATQRRQIRSEWSAARPHWEGGLEAIRLWETQRRWGIVMQERWSHYRLQSNGMLFQCRMAMQRSFLESEEAAVEQQKERFRRLSQNPLWVIAERCKMVEQECEQFLEQVVRDEAHIFRQIMTAFSLQAFRKHFPSNTVVQLDEALARGPRLRNQMLVELMRCSKLAPTIPAAAATATAAPAPPPHVASRPRSASLSTGFQRRNKFLS